MVHGGTSSLCRSSLPLLCQCPESIPKHCGRHADRMSASCQLESKWKAQSLEILAQSIAPSCCYINILFIKQTLKPTRKGLLSKNAILKPQVRTALILDSWIFLASGGAVGWWMGSSRLWKVVAQVVRQRRRHAAVGQEDRYSRFQVYVGISMTTLPIWRLHEIS